MYLPAITLGYAVPVGDFDSSVHSIFGFRRIRPTGLFERFYSERPAGEKFGTHSGLGLSISRQIVTAHGGTIVAENRRDAGGRIVGARFVVHLPVE